MSTNSTALPNLRRASCTTYLAETLVTLVLQCIVYSLIFDGVHRAGTIEDIGILFEKVKAFKQQIQLHAVKFEPVFRSPALFDRLKYGSLRVI